MARTGRAASAVARKIGPLEENFIWKEANKIFRPRYSKAASRARREAKLPDGRMGHPTHRTTESLTAPRQSQIAHELGYRPWREPHNARQPVFHNPDKEPPFISYDVTGHGNADRTGALPPNVPWKGADSAMGFGARQRTGTYVPEYDSAGNIVFNRVRR